MASFYLVPNYGFMVAPLRYRFDTVSAKSFAKYSSLYSVSTPRCRSASFSSSQHQFSSCNLGYKVVSCSEIRSLPDGNTRHQNTRLRKKDYVDVRGRFSLRLRPRLRLLARGLKRLSIQAILNDVGVFVRKNIKRMTLATSISVALGICYVLLKLTAVTPPKIVPYSDLVINLQSGSVSKVLFEEGTRRIYFNTKEHNVESLPIVEEKVSSEDVPSNNMADETTTTSVLGTPKGEGTNVVSTSKKKRTSKPKWQFSTRKVDNDESFLLSLMRQYGISYSSAPQSALASMRSILITVLTLWIPLTPLMWLLYRQLYAANSPAKRRKPRSQAVGFDDVEGVDSAKVELMEIVLCMQGAIDYSKLGARLPRGVLLVGPPGTGKTLLARAVAGEAGIPFFSVSASEFVEMFVGRGAARIRDLFSVARKNSPSIIFIDELDAVGGKRGRSLNDERDQTLNQLLTEMDGFETGAKVVVIAATNRPEALDPALCRPGRFSRKVLVGEPDEEGRRKILAVHLREVPLDEDTEVICNLVASLTPGLVGADLANIVNEAALLAARRGAETVSREDVMSAIERAKFGIGISGKKPNAISMELGKLFPWISSISGGNETQGLMGYQTLS